MTKIKAKKRVIKKTNKEAGKEVSKIVATYEEKYNTARQYGKQIAGRLVKKYKSIPIKSGGKIYNDKGLQTDIISTVLAEILYHCYMKDGEDGCRELLNEWVQGKLWGKIVTQYIPKLKAIWQFLHDNKYNKNNTLGHGDADGDIWVEYVRQEEEWHDDRKIIIHTSHCTCADDNTHIFILDESGIFGITLHVRTVWPKQNSRGGYAVKKSKKYPDGWFSWGDDRDIKMPSLNTYRKRNFKYSYQDGRDKGYVLTLEGFKGKEIEWAHLYHSRIQHALWLINLMKELIDEKKKDKE